MAVTFVAASDSQAYPW